MTKREKADGKAELLRSMLEAMTGKKITFVDVGKAKKVKTKKKRSY
jgi:hypothetical protein